MTSPDQLRPRRRATVSVDVGGVLVGSAHPIVVQSMTNTDTADADATAIQVAQLAHAGSQLVRITVNNEPAAAAVPEIIRKVRGLGVDVPMIGDFHYNGHVLLEKLPGGGRRPGQVPDQPGQRRREAPRRAFPDDRPDRDRERQAGPDRGQLGLARPGPADRADGGERPAGRAARRTRRDDRRDDPVGDALGRAGRGDRSGPRPDHPERQGLRRSRPGRRLPPAGAVVGLPAPPWPDRGGHGDEGHRLVDGRPGDPAQRGNRRHDPGLADARAGRRPRARGRGRPAGPPVDGPAQLPAPGERLPGLRPDDLDLLPGDGPGDPDLPQGPDAGLAGAPSRASRRCASR